VHAMRREERDRERERWGASEKERQRIIKSNIIKRRETKLALISEEREKRECEIE